MTSDNKVLLGTKVPKRFASHSKGGSNVPRL